MEVLDRMDAYLTVWGQSSDRRCTFLQCYRAMTANMLAALDDDFFEDRDWVNELLHRFADYYFDALYCEECGEAPSKVWQYVFDQAAARELHPMQLLLMGVNAHINYDLVFVLHDMLGVDWLTASAKLRESRRADHWRVNQVIANTIDQVQDEVIEPGHPMMAIIDSVMGRLDEYLLSRLITNWRSEVWDNAMAMVECEGDTLRLKQSAEELEAKVMHIGALMARI